MADVPTIANVDMVRWAGGIDSRVNEECLKFYLKLTSHLFREMIGDTNYDAVLNGTVATDVISRIESAEALLTVGFAYPAIAAPVGEVGLVRNMRVGVGGQVEIFSPSKEIMAMAANFINMAKSLIPTVYFQAETASGIWHTVVMNVFPGVSEIPTVGDIHSYEEEVIKTERGDRDYAAEMG